MEANLSEGQLAGGRVVVENLRVAPPLNRRFQLTPRFVVAEVFVQKIAKKFVRQRAVGFRLQRLLHLPQQRHVRQRRVAKNLLARLNIAAREFLAFRSDDRVAFFNPQQAEKHGGVHGRKQRVDFQAQVVGKPVEVHAPALVGNNFQQARHAAGARVRKHNLPVLHRWSRSKGGLHKVMPQAWVCEHAIDGIHQLEKTRCFAVARLRHLHFEIGMNVRRVFP